MAETPVLKFRLHESARTFAGSSCGDASHRANKSVSKRFYCAEEKGVFVFADGTYSIVHVREPAAGFLKYSANAMSKAKLKQADEKAAMLAAGEEEKKKSPIAPVTVAKAGTTSMDGVEFVDEGNDEIQAQGGGKKRLGVRPWAMRRTRIGCWCEAWCGFLF